jgi:hypothetical protein
LIHVDDALREPEQTPVSRVAGDGERCNVSEYHENCTEMTVKNCTEMTVKGVAPLIIG